jgi:2,7-dihydroxy-5-methyl-1-naphthoate 7-O-methyltransferase
MTDLQTPWCVYTVASLGVREHIEAGANTIGELARATGADPYALHCVLGHLVGKGVFVEPEPGRFECNDAARQLLQPSAFLDLHGIGGRMAHAWSTLPEFVRTGRPAYSKVFGLPFWEDLAAHPEVAASFDALMGRAGHGVPNPNFELAGGWEGVDTLVDVGGGTGAMLAEILRARPGLRGTLVDLPGTVARATEVFEAAGVADRVSTVARSFFDVLPSGADVYLLRKVLNDWPDQETTAILTRCAEAARPNGVIAIMGGVSPDDEPRRLTDEMPLVGGKTNTVAEFDGIARQAGLRIVRASTQPAGFLVECRPA